jgi:hypothetical protein
VQIPCVYDDEQMDITYNDKQHCRLYVCNECDVHVVDMNDDKTQQQRLIVSLYVSILDLKQHYTGAR